ncbi:MAG TPA: NBR1-Ig-like domain-containing protein, partial [Anaerolineales bacterium]|nr:NBR1-Ig-like domain-containing protein [Anaerolineales bacterium]
AGAQTMVAALFQTQTAIAPPATDTPLPTPTSLPTLASTPLVLPQTTTIATQAILFAATATPTGTFYTSTPLASSLAAGCLNLRLIKSWTEPAGQLKPGTEFTQFWQVENNGTCEWLFVFQLVHVSGDKMGGSPGRFSNKIYPGKWTTLSVGLDAPNDNGKYNATWRFSDGGGKMFGASLPVSIEVKKNPDPTATPNVLQTAAAGTVAVQLTATAQQAAILAGQTAAAGATQTAQAAATATPTLAPTATPTPTNTP